MKTYIGIDPGEKGAIVALRGGIILLKESMPLSPWGFNTRDLLSIIQHIKDLSIIADESESVSIKSPMIVFEKLHALFGVRASSTFKFGMAYQNVLSAVNISGLPFQEIKPTVWTKAMWAGESPVYKGKTKSGKAKVDTKAMSLIVASKLFPNEKFNKQTSTGKESVQIHDGIVDALLLAEYAKRMNF